MSVRFKPLALAALCVLSLASCAKKEEKVSISYYAVNHSNHSIDDVIINGAGEGLIVMNPVGESAEICCITLPLEWRPNLTVTIKWQENSDWLQDKKGNYVIRDGRNVLVPGPWKQQTVTIPKYTEKDLEHFDIHFLPNDQVQVLASYVYYGFPAYKLKFADDKQRVRQ